MKFIKMQGAGNDYIYINCMDGMPEDPSALSIKLSNRHFGAGGDGIILICPSDKADFRMRMYNADGSEAEMCGNGIRCFARYVRDKGLTSKDVIKIETLVGIKTAEILPHSPTFFYDSCPPTPFYDSGCVRINMGRPIFNPNEIPIKWDGKEFISKKIVAGWQEYTATCLSMGNPHCVVFTKTPVENINLPQIGPNFENHPMFPNRINTEFVNIMSDGSLKMRVWERGSGETLACGTGACAVGVAAIRTGAVKDDKVMIHLAGGDLFIEWPGGGDIFMTGGAEFVFEGEIES